MLANLLPLAMTVLFPGSAPQQAGAPTPAYTDNAIFAGIEGPKLGDPFEMIKEMSADVEKVATYDFGGPFDRDVERAQAAYDAAVARFPVSGGPLDMVLQGFGAATSKNVQAVSDATKRLGTQIAAELRRVDGRITVIEAKNKQQDAAMQVIRSQLSRLDLAWRNQFGSESRWRQAALFVLNQIPGLRAYDIVSSAELVAVYKYLAAVVKDAKDFDLGAPGLSTPAAVPAADTYNTVAMQSTITTINNNIKGLSDAVAAICQYLGERAESAEDLKIGEALATLQQYAVKDIFGQLGAIAPGQLEDRERAGVESIGKYMLGGARKPGQSLLSL